MFFVYSIRYIAENMFLMVKFMHAVVGADKSLYVHCAAHSLGAHACGFLGKHLIVDTDPAAKNLDRISAMDPAGPLFTNDIPYPFNKLNILPTARLGPHDATYVDVIHSDGGAHAFSLLPQVRTIKK